MLLKAYENNKGEGTSQFSGYFSVALLVFQMFIFGLG